jgi:transposase
VRQRTSQVLSIENLVVRNTGRSLSGNEVKRLTLEAVQQLLPDPRLALAVASSLVVVQTLDDLIDVLERQVLEAVRLEPAFQPLLSVPGIGRVLALTIMLETGDVHRFPGVGHFASYCRCVGSEHLSNGKRKGQGNTKNGNKYAGFKRSSRRRTSRCAMPRKLSASISASALAPMGWSPSRRWHISLPQACYYVLRDQVLFVMAKAFA